VYVLQVFMERDDNAIDGRLDSRLESGAQQNVSMSDSGRHVRCKHTWTTYSHRTQSQVSL